MENLKSSGDQISLIARLGRMMRVAAEGAGSILDVFGPAQLGYRPHKSDTEALQGDWQAVGQDFDRVIDFGKEKGDK